MPVAFRQSAGFLIYLSYTGTLTAFTGALPKLCRDLYGPRWIYGAVPVVPGAARLFPVPRRSLPVLPVDSRSISKVLNMLILSRWSPGFPRLIPVVPDGAQVHPGRAPAHPGRSRITHRGSAGITVRLSLYPVQNGDQIVYVVSRGTFRARFERSICAVKYHIR
ncbi:hypothetical protein DPMN_034098 [Dreissena polymorpha]|uniref:Uncharacterized protein n=1 Tax=Dreissena polymorpha TaxID=45954 RepID=A0A9D4M790_DREPO|nr:hypothetical protein DPMN_034098 [Dreissena polymorpha]